MDLVTIKELMAEQLDTVRKSALAAVFGWGLEERDLCAYVILRPRHCRDRSFLLRMLFDDFPRRPPSYVFVDTETREMKDGAWPPGVRHSQPPPGICTLGTRECHENYHQNDPQYRWDARPNAVLATLTEIHRMLEQGIPRN
jgi:hypothetical protein